MKEPKHLKIQDLIFSLSEPIVTSNGYDLAGVEYLKEGTNWYLRLYIDQENGITHEDCQRISHLISDLLDEKDPIPQAYFLEVSSPGVERLIQTTRDYQKFQGAVVNVTLYAPLEGKKLLTGKLGPISENMLILSDDEHREQEIPREKIAQVRLAWKD